MIKLTIILEAAATDGSWPCLSSNILTSWDNQAYQYWQSAAPPAIVANFYLLISMTFLTVYEEIKLPMVALESTANITPPWKTNPKVVVPVLKSIIFFSSPPECLIMSQNSYGLSLQTSMISLSNYSKS